MPTNRQALEGPLKQGVDESIAYTITTTPWGTAPTAVVVGVDDRTTLPAVDAAATVMPVLTTSVTGDVITLSPLKLLTAAHTYRVEVRFTVNGNVLEVYFDVLGED